MENTKKKLIVLSIILVLVIIAVAIALLCFGKPDGEPAPEQTEPTVSTDSTVPSDGSTTPPTAEATIPADPTEPIDPSIPTDPIGTIDPSAPTNATVPSSPTTGFTTPPTQSATQKPTQKPTTTPTQAPTQKPTQSATQATTPGVQLKITTPDDTVIYPGDKLQLEYIYTGNKKLTWSHSFDDIFTVDQNGLVTAVGGGSTIVKVTDGDITSRIFITVQSIVINTPENSVISVGETLQIDYKYLGKAQPLTWTSSDPSVLTVDKNGLVTGVSTGIATITVEDKHYVKRFLISVADYADRTVAFDLQIDCPLYDGVTKFAGQYLQIGHLNSHTVKANGRWSDIIDHWQAAGRHTDPCAPDPLYPNRNYYITSSNPAVVSVANKYDCGFWDDFLYFNKAGTAVITFTSWDGYSESYTIHVKADYDCAPSKTKLTPGEFAYYATMVGVEDGLEPSYHIRSYLYIWYDEDELTWETAKGLGHANAKREFFLDNRSTCVVYAGFDESNGKHLFYHGMGESDNCKIEPYTPAGSSSGKLRFPSKSIDIMEKTLKVVEALGATGDGYVTYTSSDPSIVEVSGSLLITRWPGTAVITATYKGQTATMTVNVTMNPSIERIIFEQDTYTIPLNSSTKLNYTYNGTSKLKWESSNESIARIDSAGTLVPEGMGECTIRLRSVDEYFVVGSCKIIVTEPIKYPDATEILFRDTADALYTNMELYAGDVLIIDPYAVPADSYADVFVDSSDFDVISVSFGWDAEYGRTAWWLVCYGEGKATITLTSSDGCVTKEYHITVKA